MPPPGQTQLPDWDGLKLQVRTIIASHRVVIFSKSYCPYCNKNHEISTILERQQHRVRYSDSVEPGSVIFSLSGVAFMLSDTRDLLMAGEEEFSQRIQKFMSIHRNSFLVLSAALHGPEEWNVMLRIQKRLVKFRLDLDPLLLEAKLLIEMDFHGSRFLGSNLRIIPVHNSAETVKLMLTIAKVTSKPQANDIRYKMAMTKAQIIENSPVWRMLQEHQMQWN